MSTLMILAIISIICGIVLALAMYHVFQMSILLGLLIGVTTIAGLFLIGLILSTIT